MKTILKSLILASLLLVPLSASAQKVIVQDLESWMSSLISRAIENNVEVDKNLGQERDIQKEGNPLKWRCDILTFKLPKKQRPLLEDMIMAFEENGHNNPNCYGINSKRTGTNQAEGVRNLMIGDDRNNYVTIGENYGNYLNVNILDVTDTTKTHRYAYALEWKEDRKGNAFVRYIVTYAKIPSSPTSGLGVIKYNGSVKYPFNISEKKLDAQKRYEEFIKKHADALKDLQRLGNVRMQDKLSVSGDSAFVAVSEIDDKWLSMHSVDAVNQRLAENNTLLMFSDLKKYYLNHKDAELTAISIYTLCKRANEDGLFRGDSLEELELIMCDVDKLIEQAKTETDRKYFQMAREQLDKILKSRK